MSVSNTSIQANRFVPREHWYGRISALLRVRDEAMCIADIAAALKAEKSTISARMNEMFKYGTVYYAGTKPSRTTGIKAKHYHLKLQETLF